MLLVRSRGGRARAEPRHELLVALRRVGLLDGLDGRFLLRRRVRAQHFQRAHVVALAVSCFRHVGESFVLQTFERVVAALLLQHV